MTARRTGALCRPGASSACLDRAGSRVIYRKGGGPFAARPFLRAKNRLCSALPGRKARSGRALCLRRHLSAPVRRHDGGPASQIH